MNDYLDTLLERTTEGKLSIRPRPLSLYEPALQGEGLISDMATDQAGVPAIPQVDGVKEGLSTGADMPAPSSQVPNMATHPILHAALMEAGNRSNLRDQEWVRSEPGPSPAASPIRQTRFQVEVGFVRGSNRQENEQNIEDPTMDNGSVFADVAPEQAAVERRPPDRAPRLQEDPVREPEVQVVSAAAPLLPQTVPLAPLPDSAQVDQAMDTTDVTLLQPTPSVTVHIGRIEVRMARQPTAVPAHKPAHEQRKPVMSLDHYLKLRSEEKL